MFESLVSKIVEAFEPKIKEITEEAYKKGAEDTIRRFAFVYDTIAQIAKSDAYAEAGMMDIEEISADQFKELTQ